MNATALHDWLPYRLQNGNENALCRWLCTKGERFTEPFFMDTIPRLMRLPENSKRYQSFSSLDVLPGWSEGLEAAPPAAFIFHVSRCGSTLLSQLLALSPENNVLSEVPFFDELLRLPFADPSVKEETSARLFQSALPFYNQQEKKLFIKTDSWHIFFYDLLRRLYPSTPFVLLYREPAAVLRSQQKQRGMHAVPGVIQPAVFGMSPEEIAGLSFDDYLAKVVERYFDQFLRIAQNDKNILLSNYSEGLLNAAKRLYQFTGMGLSEEEERRMEERSHFHAKRPEQLFSETSALPDGGAAWSRAQELYHQLETIRLSRIMPA